MSSSWFRLYDEVVDDPKVQLLPDKLFRAWINLMCIASRNTPRGTLPPISQVAYRLHVSTARAQQLLSGLVEAGLFDWQEGIAVPHNWSGRQFQSDTSRERTAKWREKRYGDAAGDVTVTASVTPPDTDTETDTEQRGIPPTPLGGIAAARRRDLAADLFIEAFREFRRIEYRPKKGDWIQLAQLRQTQHVPHGEAPEAWQNTCRNYLTSPLPNYTLADMCTRYPIFFTSGVDRYNRPLGGPNGSDTKVDRTLRNAQNLLRRIDQQDREREQRGTQRGHDGRLPGTADPPLDGPDGSGHDPHDS